ITQGEVTTGLARNPKRLHAGGAKVGVHDTDRMIADDVARTGDRKCCNGYAAGERLELHDAERVGQTWKNEDVGGGKMRGENAVVELAEKLGGGETALKLGLLRPGADHNFRARQIERKKSWQIFLDRHPPYRHEDRPREIQIDRAIGTEQID